MRPKNSELAIRVTTAEDELRRCTQQLTDVMGDDLAGKVRQLKFERDSAIRHCEEAQKLSDGGMEELMALRRDRVLRESRLLDERHRRDTLNNRVMELVRDLRTADAKRFEAERERDKLKEEIATLCDAIAAKGEPQ